MTLNSIAGRWARTALVWFVLTILFGMYMGVTQQFELSSPHAHMGLLGWVSAALFAFLHAFAGDDQRGRSAIIHWVAHNLGVATMVTGMFMTARVGPDVWTLLIPLGGIVVVVATIWLALMFWPRLSGGRTTV
jgi:hypothetical protein